MSIREIPRAFEYTCDFCKTDHLQQNAGSRPSGWGNLKLERDATDCQGNAVADGSQKWLVCPKCLAVLISTFDANLIRRLKQG